MNTYETMILLDNREVKKGWDALKSDVCGLLQKHDAKIVSARVWEERRLAYPIKGQLRATYLLVYHNASAGSITPMNRDLQYAESVLRHLTLQCEEIPEEAHEPEAAFNPDEIPEEDTPAIEVVVEEPKADEKSDKKSDKESDVKAAGDDSAKAEGDAPKADGESGADQAEGSGDTGGAATEKKDGGDES